MAAAAVNFEDWKSIFWKALTIVLTRCTFKYASREDIFFIKLWKWKSRFFKMSAPSAAPPGSFAQKYHQIQPAPAWFLVQFWRVCLKQKASASPSSFHPSWAARPLHRRRRRCIRWQSLLGFDNSLNCTNIPAQLDCYCGVFLFLTEPDWGYEVFLQVKCTVLHYISASIYQCLNKKGLLYQHIYDRLCRNSAYVIFKKYE